MTFYEKSRAKMYKAIEEGVHYNFYKMALNVNNVIFFDGRFLTKEEQESLKKEYLHYLRDVMFQRDVEIAHEDCYGNLYKSFGKFPYGVFFRSGPRWIKTRKMLFSSTWMMKIGGGLESMDPSDMSLDILPPEPVRARNLSYMKQDFYLLNE